MYKFRLDRKGGILNGTFFIPSLTIEQNPTRLLRSKIRDISNAYYSTRGNSVANICSATAFMCMCSGVEPSAELSGAPYVQAALNESLGNFGPIFITVAMILFAFTTLLGNIYYVDMAIIYLCKKTPKKWVMNVYHVIAAVLIFIGAGLSADLLWNIADIAMGGMTIINIPVIFILSKYAIAALNDYSKQRKQGVDPVFKAKNINLPHDVDCWK